MSRPWRPSPLGDALTLTVKTLGTGCATFDGTTVVAAARSMVRRSAARRRVPRPGDRTLAFAGSEVLCFRFLLPTGDRQRPPDQSTSATFTFDAEQTANNP